MKKRLLFLLVLMVFSILLSTSSCDFFREMLPWQNTEQRQEVNNKGLVEWQQVKGRLSIESPAIGDVNNFILDVDRYGFTIQSNEVAEVINVINISNNSDLKLRLLQEIKSFIKDDLRVLSLVRNLAASEDRLLAPAALKMLISSELTRDENGQDQWETWQWSEEVKSLLEQAVNVDLFKLPSYDLELLRLVNRYPNSKLAEGAREYGRLTGGETYFGAYIDWPDDQPQPVLRIPFNPEAELEVWPEFLQKYPDHPASDDAMYRIARSYELQGQYGKSVIAYYKASRMPDGRLSGVAADRALFLLDLLMDSEALAKLIESNPHPELIPSLEYTKAVHLIRDNNLSLATSELQKFASLYRTRVIKDLWGFDIKPEFDFWRNVMYQIKDIEKLEYIRNKLISDERLYDEAVFWFDNYFSAYNHLWNWNETLAFRSFIPESWEGSQTAILRSLRYRFFHDASKGYTSQNGYLISISILEKLLEDYPESKLTERAKYSITLNYYYLHKQLWAISDYSGDWAAHAIRNAYEFVDQFPKSSMADDALLTIGEIADPLTRLNALERLFKDYPNSDRKKSARSLLESAKLDLANLEREDGVVAVGLQLGERRTGLFNLRSEAFLAGVIPFSPAAQSGLIAGDTILEVDGRAVANSIDVRAYVRSHNPGEIVQFKVRRGEETLSINATTVLVPK